MWSISPLFLLPGTRSDTPQTPPISLKSPHSPAGQLPLLQACPESAPRGLQVDTHDDFHKIVGLPRSPVFPGHLGGAPRIARWV